MKAKTNTLFLVVTMAIGLISFQLVPWMAASDAGGAAMGSDTYNSQNPSVMIMKVVVSPGSEPGKYDILVTAADVNFEVVDLQGEQNIPKVGHVHFYLDVKPMAAKGKPAIPPEGSVWAHVSDLSYTFTNVSPGKHKVYVELVNNDHTPFSPAVRAWKTVNIKS